MTTVKIYDIETSEIQKLLGIIQPAPLLRIGHFSDSGKILPSVLNQFCATHTYEYLLNCTEPNYYTALLTHYKEEPSCTIKQFDLNRPNYMQHGKFYDYLFVSATIASDQREAFLQKCHRVIKNAGLILIFFSSKEHEEQAHWYQLLEENYFVATNMIILDTAWSVIISKKMHGWGG